MKQTALILIDIQNDYFTNGALTLCNADDAAIKAKTLLELFRDNNYHVVHIQHENTIPESGFMLTGTRGQAIHQYVAPRNTETCITKNFPNSFWKTNLESHLKDLGIQHIVVAGMMTHMCVSSTVRGANERRFSTTLIHDACATKTLEFDGQIIPSKTVHSTALAELTMLAEICSTKEFINNSF